MTISSRALRTREAFRIEANSDAFVRQDVGDRRRYVFILARNQPRAVLDDGDLAAEAPKHLTELQADVTAAEHHQMVGQEVDVHHRAVGEVIDLVEARDRPARPHARRH